MALRVATYTFGDALSSISRQFPRIVEDSNAPLIANLAIDKVWQRYDWKQSIRTLPPFFLAPNEQDYSYPASVIPADFFGLRKAYIARTLTEPPQHWPLSIIRDLELTHVRSFPKSIAFDRAISGFRLFPRVPSNIGAPDYVVEGEYKCLSPRITASRLMSTTLPFDDTYIGNLLEAFKWAAYNLAGDPKAGDVKYFNGTAQYSGQLAKMMAAIDDMAGKEGLELGDPSIHPAEPLVGSSIYTPCVGQWW